GSLTWRDVARVLSETPALIGRDEDQGRPLAAGSPGHVLVWDPRPLSIVDPTEHASRSVNSPVAGLELPGRNRLTVLGGRITVRDGAIAEGWTDGPAGARPAPGCAVPGDRGADASRLAPARPQPGRPARAPARHPARRDRRDRGDRPAGGGVRGHGAGRSAPRAGRRPRPGSPFHGAGHG